MLTIRQCWLPGVPGETRQKVEGYFSGVARALDGVLVFFDDSCGRSFEQEIASPCPFILPFMHCAGRFKEYDPVWVKCGKGRQLPVFTKEEMIAKGLLRP